MTVLLAADENAIGRSVMSGENPKMSQSTAFSPATPRSRN
jgi:hypothetical protein